MSSINVKLGATLTFDAERERDIVANIQLLLSKHKLGPYINKLLRYAWEHPEEFEGTELDMAEWGLTHSRSAFFASVEKELRKSKSNLAETIDSLHEITTAIKVGQNIGLIGKVETTALAVFAIQKHMESFSKALDISYSLNKEYEKDKAENIQTIAEKAAELVLEMLGGKEAILEEAGKPQKVSRVQSESNDYADRDDDESDTTPVPTNVRVESILKASSGKKGTKVDTQNNPGGSPNNIPTIEKKEESTENNAMDMLAEFCGISED